MFKVGDRVTVKAHAGLKGDCSGEVTEVGGSIPCQMYSVKIDGLEGCMGCVPEDCLTAHKESKKDVPEALPEPDPIDESHPAHPHHAAHHAAHHAHKKDDPKDKKSHK